MIDGTVYVFINGAGEGYFANLVSRDISDACTRIFN